ncbi:MAG TPA: ketopantoate reductase family protein [Rubrivivax sp.]|mgnify:CR=1 FL=1|nr:ketopantoate reductase family protein [Rubrivivax sp.]
MVHKRRIGVMGAGAVGSFYGAMLARAGHQVTLVGRPAHVQAIRRDGLKLQMGGAAHTVPLQADSDAAALRGSELVLCCVKSGDSEAAARQMAPHLDASAWVMSLQNGVDNAEILAKHLPCRVIAAVVYVAVALGGPGVVRHFGRGDLAVGALPGGTASSVPEWPRLQALVDLFADAQLPVRIVPDVAVELWAKLLVNCAYNAISALAQMPYAALAALPQIREVQELVVQEVIAVAAACGVTLPLQASREAVAKIAAGMPQQLSSTAQDVARRKPSEIDHLNGFVARRGRELGVPAPVNQTLHALVKLVESGYGAPS